MKLKVKAPELQQQYCSDSVCPCCGESEEFVIDCSGGRNEFRHRDGTCGTKTMAVLT